MFFRPGRLVGFWGVGGMLFLPTVLKILMAESKIFKGQRNRRVIDVNDPIDVEYVHHQFPWLTHKEIKEVIKKHGPDRDTVQSILERSGKRQEGGEE
jgi:hypothetical protein